MRPFSFFTAITEQTNHKKFFESIAKQYFQKISCGLDLSAKRCRF